MRKSAAVGMRQRDLQTFLPDTRVLARVLRYERHIQIMEVVSVEKFQKKYCFPRKSNLGGSFSVSGT
jgi:hypothetical protein